MKLIRENTQTGETDEVTLAQLQAAIRQRTLHSGRGLSAQRMISYLNRTAKQAESPYVYRKEAGKKSTP